MELVSSLGFFSTLKPIRLNSTCPPEETKFIWRKRMQQSAMRRISAISYQEFVRFALEETKLHTVVKPSPLQKEYNSTMSQDGRTELQMQAIQSQKIRLLRSMNIESESMKVLDFAAFPEPRFDAPIFCANFFTSVNMNIVVLDLNPLYNQPDYRKKYFKKLMPLYLKYAELLPWGGKLTAESIKFFSPIVIWTKFTSRERKHEVLYSAFVDYYKAWLELMDQVTAETVASQVECNQELQHRYLTWRAEKDPGHGVLKRLIGENHAKDLLRNFLFNGIEELGSKTFIDYFPEYRCENGVINEKRSMMGKAYQNRPWDFRGEFIDENFRP